MGYGGRILAAAVATISAFAIGGVGQSLVIPSVPGLLVPTYLGAPATAQPTTSAPVPQNPFMAPNPGNSMHNDSYSTNTYSGPGPLGRAPKVTDQSYGVEECATVAFDHAGNLVGLCGNLSGPDLRLINPATLTTIAKYTMPPRPPGGNPFQDLCGGSYFYLDNQGRAVVETTDKHIDVFSESAATGFSLMHSYDLSAAVPSSDCLIALMPDWGGRIWFVTSAGIVGDIDPVTGAVHTIALHEGISNSFSTDDTGGVFIVTDAALYRFDADPVTGAPQVTWRQTYDVGTRQKPGQLEQGSGTTPALVGSNLIAITDNADPQMHVMFFQRGASSGGAPVCQAPVFTPGKSDTENSLVVVGNSVFVENNYGYAGPQSTLLGKTTTGGLARVDVTGNQCSVAWTNPIVAPTSVAKASLASGLLYVYTKPANALTIDAWYFSAIDLRTGATVYSVLAGTGPLFNNHYAAIYLAPDGSEYIATLAGMVHLRDTA